MPINIYIYIYIYIYISNIKFVYVMYLCLINVIIGITYKQKYVFRIALSWTGRVDRADHCDTVTLEQIDN